jgi:DNA adenine methylase
MDNYIFITTEKINREVQEYAHSLYLNTGGIEFVILDCISFIRYFLHLFYRLRSNFLEVYQELILAKPENSIGQPISRSILVMRQAVEVNIENSED